MKKIFNPQVMTKLVLSIRIESILSCCGLDTTLPFDVQKVTRKEMVDYHNYLIDTYNVNTNIFEKVR